jgi:L-fuculose-phosphate aldolase
MLDQLKRQVVETSANIYRKGLTWGPGGNVSAYDPDRQLAVISPTGLALDTLTPESVCVVDLSGRPVEGDLKPSSETPMHMRVYRDLGKRYRAVVHTHSTAATALACLRLPVPAIHYLMGCVGQKVPVASYATYGTAEMGDRVVEVIGENKAVLLANHGVLAVGRDPAEAAWVAEAVEYVAVVFLQARAVGSPIELPAKEIENLKQRFAGYGQ